MRELKVAFVTIADQTFLPGLDKLDKSLNEHVSLAGIDKILISDDITEYKDYRIVCPDENIFAGIPAKKRFKKAFYKLLIFGMVEYDKIIYMDSDILCIGDVSELIHGYNNRDMYAASDDGIKLNNSYKKSFIRINAGVMVINRILIRPDVMAEMIQMAREGLSYDGGDQGIINEYLLRHKVDFGYLRQKYNTLKRIYHHHPEVWEKLKSNIRLLHFVGGKPWRDEDENDYAELNQIWWKR